MTTRSEKLNDILDRAANCLKTIVLMVDGHQLTSEEIKYAQDQLNIADAIVPIIDPTAYRDALYTGSIDRMKKRLSVLLTITELLETEAAKGAKVD